MKKIKVDVKDLYFNTDTDTGSDIGIKVSYTLGVDSTHKAYIFYGLNELTEIFERLIEQELNK